MDHVFLVVLAVLGGLTGLGIFMTLIEKFCKSIHNYAYASRVPAPTDAVSEARSEIKEQVKAFKKMEDEPFIKQQQKVTEPASDVGHVEKSMVEETEQVMLDISGFDDKVTVKVGNKAIVTARYYKGEQVVVRHMNILDERIRKRLGKRMQLPPLKINNDWLHAKYQVIKTTRQDVNNLFKAYTNGQQEIARSQPPVESSEVVNTTPNVVEKQEVVQPAMTPESVPESVDNTARSKAKAIMKGVLQAYGLSDRVQGDKSFKHYKVDFIDSETSLLETVWGEDLKRALNSCGAKKGDLIEIFKLGRKPVEGEKTDGEKRFMNKWHIVVLNSKSMKQAH